MFGWGASAAAAIVQHYKEAVRVATTVAGVLATDFEVGDTIDGVVLALNDRILIKNQATGSENGIYTANAVGAPTRASDFDTSAEVKSGVLIPVSEGTVNADTLWMLATNDPIVIGVTSLTFVRIGGSGVVTGTGTVNTVPKFIAASVIADSSITDDGTTVQVGSAGSRFLSCPGSGLNSEAFGASAIATAPEGVAVGFSSTASGANGSIAVGRMAAASALSTVAIGESSAASAPSAIALGKSSIAAFDRDIVIGDSLTTAGAGAGDNILIGSAAGGNVISGAGGGSIAIRGSVIGAGTLNIAILGSVTATAPSGAIAIGPSASVSGTTGGGCIAIGNLASNAANNSALCLGDGATCDATSSGVIIGAAATATINAFDAVAIGNSATTADMDTVVIGGGASASFGASGAVVVGKTATANANPRVVSIGIAATAGITCIAIGDTATCTACTDTVVLGGLANAQNVNGFASDDSVLIGANATLLGGSHRSVVIGETASMSGPVTDCVVIGQGAAAGTGNYSIVIGSSFSSVNGTGSIVIGAACVSSHNGSIVLGYGAGSTNNNQFIVGSPTAPISEVWFGQGTNDTTPDAEVRIRVTDGNGVGVQGSRMALIGGLGGAAATVGGDITFSLGLAGSGTTATEVGRWNTGNAGSLIIGGTAPSGAEKFRVVGDARVEGKLTVTGAIDPTDITLSGGGTAHFMQWAGGSTAAVSAANTGRIVYNETLQAFRVSSNGGAYTTLPSADRSNLQFGNIVLNATGTLQMLGAGSTTIGYRAPRAGTITAASIQVNAADATRTYNLEVRVNGISVATVTLATTTTGNHSAALSAAFVAGDLITAFLVRTAGAGASTFTSESALVEVTY